MRFEEVLAGLIDEDDGLLLSVAAHERMLETGARSRGWSARILHGLRRRSGKIESWIAAGLGRIRGRD